MVVSNENKWLFVGHWGWSPHTALLLSCFIYSASFPLQQLFLWACLVLWLTKGFSEHQYKWWKVWGVGEGLREQMYGFFRTSQERLRDGRGLVCYFFQDGVVSMAAHLPPLIPPAPKGKKFLSNSIWVELLLPGSNGLERLCFLMLRHGPQLRRAAGHGCVSVCCMAPLHCFCWGSCSRGSTVSWLREIIRLKAFADLSGGGMEKGKGGLVIFRYCGSTEDLFALCTVTAWLCYQLWGGNKWGLRTRSFLALASVQGCGFF